MDLKTINVNQLSTILRNYFQKKDVIIKEIAFGNNYRDYNKAKIGYGGMLDITFVFDEETKEKKKRMVKEKKPRKERKDPWILQERTIKAIRTAEFYVVEDGYGGNEKRFWCVKNYGGLYWRTHSINLNKTVVSMTNQQSGYFKKEFDTPEKASFFFNSLRPQKQISGEEAHKLIIIKKTPHKEE